MPRTTPSRRPTDGVSDAVAVLVGVGIMVLCWMFLMPPGSGPDEPGHLVRSGAVIRGDLENQNDYLLPDRFQVAEPGCYAFQPSVAVTCAAPPLHTGQSLDLPTNAGPYPIWGHAVYGALTVLPGPDPIWWARLAGAGVAILLVGASLVRARRRPAAAGLLIGMTPMAWSTFGTVNPSAIAIAGAVAVWTGLLVTGHGTDHDTDHDIDHEHDTAVDDTGDERRWPIGAGWLTAVGWAALVLPRRDGLVWACIGLVIALAVTDRTFVEWWRSLARWQQATIAASTIVTMVWGLLSGSRSTQLVVIAPLLVAASEGWRIWWNRPVHTSATRWASAVAAGVVGVLATYVVIGTRPGGWDTDFAIDVVMQTDDNLIEAIGVLGWLDTVVPAGVVHLWLIALGMLIATALSAGAQRQVVGASVLAASAVVSSWVLELVQGNTSGTYWQGRYSIPLIVGVPLLLTTGDRIRLASVVHRAVGVIGLIVVNIAAWAAARRFGVGTSGSLLPWRWDTSIQPIPPVVVLVVLAAASCWLAFVLIRPTTNVTNQG